MLRNMYTRVWLWLLQGGGAMPPTTTRWILRTGFWDDTGIWIDTESWIDVL